MKKIKVKQQNNVVQESKFDPVELVNQHKGLLVKIGIVVLIAVIFAGSFYVYSLKGKAADLGLIVEAKSLYSSGKYNEALNAYDQFISEYPKHQLVPAALLGKAYCFEGLGEYKKADGQYMKVQKGYPNSVWNEEAAKGIARIALIK